MSSDIHDGNREALIRLLAEAGVRPSRSSGQNFLVDGPVADALVDAAKVGRGDKVLEIGPGFGALTGALLERGARVTAVEIDRRLASFLKRRFSSEKNVTVIEGDIRTAHLDAIVDDGGYKLVSSLPFNVTSLVLRRFLEQRPRPTVLSLLIQKEVAERVTAEPGAMSTLSVAIQYYGSPAIVRTVPRTSFYPAPEVDGAVVRIDVRALPSHEEAGQLFRMVRIGFSSRRKMLHNTLSVGLHLPSEKIQTLLSEIGLNPLCRPQEVSVSQWLMLAKKLF